MSLGSRQTIPSHNRVPIFFQADNIHTQGQSDHKIPCVYRPLFLNPSIRVYAAANRIPRIYTLYFVQDLSVTGGLSPPDTLHQPVSDFYPQRAKA